MTGTDVYFSDVSGWSIELSESFMEDLSPGESRLVNVYVKPKSNADLVFLV